MSAAYDQLLDATIRHLEDLKSRGVRYVAVAPETLRALAQPPQRASAVANRLAAAPVPKANPVPAYVAPQPPLSRVPEPVTTPIVSQAKVPTPAPTVPPAPVSVSDIATGDKAADMAALRARALICIQCPHLASSRKNVVFGVGDINARLMFVGEAPGAEEDQQGEPFVGRAGQLLTKIIQATGLSRTTVYIANILKCRPDTPGESAGNRKPTPEEMATCIPYLHQQIDLIQPAVIIALGGTAVEGLLGKTVGITKLRGNWQTYRGIPLMPTYHPSYLLRNQAITEKRKVWEDMLQAMEKLGLPISEKQRNYFLRG
jgi:uracil-DNA glycosylase family 4